MAMWRDEDSIIELVQDIIAQAVANRASDIHLEPQEKSLRVRFRYDGVLYDQKSISHRYISRIIARCKVLGSMNTAESRVPQDGKFSQMCHGQHIDFRVSSFPSLYGEKIVIRILDRSQHMMTLDHLGLSSEMEQKLTVLLHKSSGFLLVAGPTGSGKTTTLYAALSSLNTTEKNIITLEDPVEYDIPGITQGHIWPEAGFTFEKGIRALLRQDPDIIMIGEMRDAQTAHIAIQAALTGHSVLSTVHTNDAPSVIMRLLDIGIEPFLINASVTGVLAQRLARRICQTCKYEYEPSAAEQEIVQPYDAGNTLRLYEGKGCDSCNHLGYRGRIGIFELLLLDAEFRSRVMHNPSHDELYSYAEQHGMHTLMQDGVHKVLSGVISLKELLRVV